MQTSPRSLANVSGILLSCRWVCPLFAQCKACNITKDSPHANEMGRFSSAHPYQRTKRCLNLIWLGRGHISAGEARSTSWGLRFHSIQLTLSYDFFQFFSFFVMFLRNFCFLSSRRMCIVRFSQLGVRTFIQSDQS